jgi:hypothetical protein
MAGGAGVKSTWGVISAASMTAALFFSAAGATTLGDLVGNAVGNVVGDLTHTAGNSAASSATASGSKRSTITIDGQIYSYGPEDFLYKAQGGKKIVFSDHDSFRNHALDDEKNYVGVELSFAKDGSAKREWIRVLKTSCHGGTILLEASRDGKNWGVQRYENESFVKGRYLRYDPRVDYNRTGYADSYYLCLRKTGIAFVVPPGGK